MYPKQKSFSEAVSYRTYDVADRYARILCVLSKIRDEALDDLFASLYAGTEEETLFFDELSSTVDEFMIYTRNYLSAKSIFDDTCAPIRTKAPYNSQEVIA